jgi:hypothetical protein
VSLETYDDARNGLAHYQQPTNQLTVRPRTVQRLTEWAESAQAAYEVATKLVTTSFVPEVFRNKPHEATAAILAGDELGFSPMASLRAFDVIQGTAAPKAITQRAVVQSRGHDIWKVESTSTRAIFRGRRAGANEVQESVWTIERARQLGLASKPNWKNQPEAMLIARATAECSRLVASDALLGIPYSAEELADGVYGDLPAPPPPELPSAPPAPARRTAQRRTRPRQTATQSEPPAEPSEEPQGPPLPGEDGFEDEQPAPAANDPATRPQLTKLHTIFGKGGIDNRDTRLAACSLIVGRELTSSADLTKEEAIKLIETLDDLAKDPAGLAEKVAELVDTDGGDES